MQTHILKEVSGLQQNALISKTTIFTLLSLGNDVVPSTSRSSCVLSQDFERQRSAFEQQRWQYQWPFFDFDGAWLCAAATTATKSMATDDAHESSSLWCPGWLCKAAGAFRI